MAEPQLSQPYAAVSVEPDWRGCCKAAEDIAGQRHLLSEAPMLPLTDCTRPAQCKCKYKKWEDRRQEDRRALDSGIASQYYAADDKRGRRRGRRRTD